jgi:hypothetical protein
VTVEGQTGHTVWFPADCWWCSSSSTQRTVNHDLDMPCICNSPLQQVTLMATWTWTESAVPVVLKWQFEVHCHYICHHDNTYESLSNISLREASGAVCLYSCAVMVTLNEIHLTFTHRR